MSCTTFSRYLICRKIGASVIMDSTERIVKPLQLSDFVTHRFLLVRWELGGPLGLSFMLLFSDPCCFYLVVLSSHHVARRAIFLFLSSTVISNNLRINKSMPTIKVEIYRRFSSTAFLRGCVLYTYLYTLFLKHRCSLLSFSILDITDDYACVYLIIFISKSRTITTRCGQIEPSIATFIDD